MPFPPADVSAWHDRLRRELGDDAPAGLSSRLRGGLEVRPLYGPADVGAEPPPPGTAPYVRGVRAGGTVRPWRVARIYDRGGPVAAAAAIRRDLELGVELLWLGLASAESAASFSGSTTEGLRVATAADFARLLEDVDPTRVAVVIDAGAATPPVAALYLAALRRRGIVPGALRGGFACDPLGALARRGRLDGGVDAVWDELAALLARTLEDLAPGFFTATVSTVPYHEAGADPVEELALGLATGVEYLRRLAAAGFAVAAAAPRIAFVYAVGADLFPEIAKLRAARLLWARAVAAAGGDDAARTTRLHVRTSRAFLARRAPWMNQLRITAGAFAAVAGNADSVATGRWDELLRDDDGDDGAVDGVRLALTTQHILAEEAHLGRVADPGGGSYYLERLTDDLARAAWERFRAIERRGGMLAALLDGHVGRRLAAAAREREEAIARRREPLIGVSAFANPAEEPPPAAETAAGDGTTSTGGEARAAGDGATSTGDGTVTAGDETTAGDGTTSAGGETVAAGDGTAATDDADSIRLPAPLAPRRWAEPWEALRATGEGLATEPAAVLLGLGRVAEHQPQSGFATRVLAAGGIAAATAEGLETAAAAERAYRDAGAPPIAVLCAPPSRAGEILPELVPALRAAGARRIVLCTGEPAPAAGRMGADARAAGDADDDRDGDDRGVGHSVDELLGEGLDLIALLRRLHAAAAGASAEGSPA